MTGSYKTIGKAVGISQNTVRKYVMALEEKGLIRTESTSVRTQSGQMRNSSLLYTIRPIQEALDLSYERQTERAETAVTRQRAAGMLAAVSPYEPLCGALTPTGTAPPKVMNANMSRCWAWCKGRKAKQDKGQASQARQPGHNCPHYARRHVSEANRQQCWRHLGRRCAGSFGGLGRGS